MIHKFKKGDYAIWAFPENNWRESENIERYRNKIVKIIEINKENYDVKVVNDFDIWEASFDSLIPYKPILKKFIEEMEKDK